MVRAILDGRKTQTRRLVKLVFPGEPYVDERHCDRVGFFGKHTDAVSGLVNHTRCFGVYHAPHGPVGRKLWVRETFQSFGDSSGVTPPVPHACQIRYDADGTTAWLPVPEGARGVFPASLKKRPAIHMPMWAARIWLEVTGSHYEQLQDITEEDAMAEGVEHWDRPGALERDYKLYVYGRDLERLNQWSPRARLSYQTLWEAINGEDSWDANPWVWVYGFRRIERPAGLLKGLSV